MVHLSLQEIPKSFTRACISIRWSEAKRSNYIQHLNISFHACPISFWWKEKKRNVHESTWRAVNVWVTEHLGSRVWVLHKEYLDAHFQWRRLGCEPCWFGNVISCQAGSGRWVVLSWEPNSGIFKMWSWGSSDSEAGAQISTFLFVSWHESVIGYPSSGFHQKLCQPFHSFQSAGFLFSGGFLFFVLVAGEL